MDTVEFKHLKIGSIFKIVDCKNHVVIEDIVLIKIKPRPDKKMYPSAIITKSKHTYEKLKKGYPFYLKDFDKTVLIEE